jgi:hypothetical protein
MTSVLAATAALVAVAGAASHAGAAQQHAVGGTPVPMGTFPWAVALEKADDDGGAPVKFCGGALIAPGYVLTAGHCAQMEGLDDPADLRKAGLAVRFANLEGQPAIAATRMVVPGSFWVYAFGRRQQNDIAVIELATPAPTAPMALSTAVPPRGEPVMSLGYGPTADAPGMSDALRQSWSVVSDPRACGGLSPGGFTVRVFPAAEICSTPGPSSATPPLDGASCPGDSGGPLVDRGLTAVVGVTSWGRVNACRAPASERSTVFARVGPVAGWLRRQTGASLFGLPPVAVDRAAPRNATFRVGRLVGTSVPVRVSARGTNWRAVAYVQFARDVADRFETQTVALSLGPGQRSGVVRAPASWGASPPGLDVVQTAARVWRPGNLNGVTLSAG